MIRAFSPLFVGLLATAVFTGCATSDGGRAPSALQDRRRMKDHYRDFASLAKHHRRGTDYEIVTRAPSVSSTLVMAIHGGNIEPGTTELAEVVAGKDLGFYSFIGRHRDVELLHITSTRFDEPTLLALLPEAENCLSLHGFWGEEADFCVGGANAEERKKYAAEIERVFPEYRTCDACCPPFVGTSEENVVNRCRAPGVQIEMSPLLRDRIVEDDVFRARLGELLRGRLATSRRN
jgi:phage replication-related protein YjqB (UPF0714/DUF867 family)